MEKEMTRCLLNYLKVEYFLLWILCAATVLLYEMDILPQGIFVDDPRADYILQVVGILLTVHSRTDSRITPPVQFISYQIHQAA